MSIFDIEYMIPLLIILYVVIGMLVVLAAKNEIKEPKRIVCLLVVQFWPVILLAVTVLVILGPKEE